MALRIEHQKSQCSHQDVCSGCPWIELSEAEQRSRKIQTLSETLLRNELPIPASIGYQLPAGLGLRDRVDLTYSKGNYGFYQKESREIFPVQECPQMSTDLFEFYQQVSKISIPIEKGSLRLRVSATDSKLRGIWLDFANEDIKHLFEEKKTLQQLMALGFVEIGQRRKSLRWDSTEERFRLDDPIYRPWLRSWQGSQSFALYSLIGSFSQTGDLANQALVKTIEGFLKSTTAKNWVEFGCGSGNLTIPMASDQRNVIGVEYDEGALQGLQQTLEANPSLKNRISLKAGDFQKKEKVSFLDVDGILVNPPRSGLGDFLTPLENANSKPRDFIYMSCFLDSFAKDAVQMKSLGYLLKELIIVDQFPQTSHFEILSRWQLTD